jgi:hypothetical protein
MGKTVDIRDITLFRDTRGWGVALALQDGRRRRLRYGSEAQARFFAAVLALKPRQLPEERRRRPAAEGRCASRVPGPLHTAAREVEEVWLDELPAPAPPVEQAQGEDTSLWAECL